MRGGRPQLKKPIFKQPILGSQITCGATVRTVVLFAQAIAIVFPNRAVFGRFLDLRCQRFHTSNLMRRCPLLPPMISPCTVEA